jgi:hypothetical protein
LLPLLVARIPRRSFSQLLDDHDVLFAWLSATQKMGIKNLVLRDGRYHRLPLAHNQVSK